MSENAGRADMLCPSHQVRFVPKAAVSGCSKNTQSNARRGQLEGRDLIISCSDWRPIFCRNGVRRQPPTRHWAEVARQLDWAGVETAVDVDLLMRGGFAPSELLESAQGTGSSETSRTCWSATFSRIAVAA
jgi:hypothetical protein